MFSGTELGSTTSAIQAFMPVAPPTEPTAMAAVRNMRDLMSTAFQLAGGEDLADDGHGEADADGRVTQPM